LPPDPRPLGPHAGEPAAVPPECAEPLSSKPGDQRKRQERLGLDRLGFIQAIGGLVLGLIALFTSYDHLSVAGRTIAIPQQWGIPLIAASVAIIFIDAQLATGSRLRADEARECQAQIAERQNEDLALLRRSAVLSARVELDPTPSNRSR